MKAPVGLLSDRTVLRSKMEGLCPDKFQFAVLGSSRFWGRRSPTRALSKSILPFVLYPPVLSWESVVYSSWFNKSEVVGVLNMKFPFYDAPNTATITCCHILENGEPILYVSHDEDDGMWQFLCGKAHETDEAKLVSLKSVFDLDNSVGILKDMPCGYYAERKAQDDEWSVRKR